MANFKLIRITTIPGSLRGLLRGQLRFMSENGFEVIAISSSGKALQDVEKNEGVRTYAVEMSRRISPLNDLKSVWQLYKIFKREKPDIVHTHTPKAGTVGMLAAWLARVPIRLHTVAGLPLMETTGMKRKLLNYVEKWTYRLATKVYPNSCGLKDFILQEKLCSDKKTHVIANGSSNGIDTYFFSNERLDKGELINLRSSLHIALNDFVFIFVGRLVGDKGINELVSAFSKLRKQNAKLLLVGPLEEKLDPLLPNTLNEIRCNKSIISVGFQKDVRPYFAIANALAFPSYREGFPNVVMQAGAMGLPSIVTDINGCNEIIINKKNGIIIPAKNEKKLLEAMHLFVDNENELRHMAANSRQLIVNRYEQHMVWNTLLEEYKKLEKYFLEIK